MNLSALTLINTFLNHLKLISVIMNNYKYTKLSSANDRPVWIDSQEVYASSPEEAAECAAQDFCENYDGQVQYFAVKVKNGKPKLFKTTSVEETDYWHEVKRV